MAGSEVSGISKQLSQFERIELLKISYRHRSRFLHCPTTGKDPEKDVWTSIMEEFSSTVRAGVFNKYAQVKKATNMICKNRRKQTKGTTPPQRRSRMVHGDKWIDNWVCVWRCRDLIIKTAKVDQAIREVMGEKKIKKMFCDRIAGTELPQETGELTFSAPIWKGIQKEIRDIERSSRGRHFSLYSSEDESDFTDDDGTEDDAVVGLRAKETLLQSIEADVQSDVPSAPEDLPSAQPNQRVSGGVNSPDLSPAIQERLKELEKGFINVLKANRTATGEKMSVLGLAQRSSNQQRISSPEALSHLQGALVHRPPKLPLKNKKNEQLTTILAIKTPRSEQGRSGNDDTYNSISLSFAPSQHLKPGTYSAGESVLVGWHARQIPLTGMNVTAEQDFRQTVFATISTAGIINFRLRSQNIQGQTVPSNFRLGKTVSVSRKDVIYHPAFDGMSYEEVQLEVARQSLLSVDQRTVSHQVPPTLITEITGENSRKDIMASEHEVREERPETFARSSAREDGRGCTPLKTNKEKSSASTLKRPGTPKVLRKFLDDEAKKRQKPLAPVKIPYISTPPRKPSPKSKKPSRCNRITPWRFYGKKPPERVPAAEEHEPNQKQNSEYRLPIFSQSSTDFSGKPQHKLRDRRTAGPCHGSDAASCDTMPFKYSSPTIARPHRYDSSDDESLPDVEELYRRRLANKIKSSSDASTSHELHILRQIPVDTGVTHKTDASQVYSDPQNSGHAQAQTDIHACHSEDLAGPKRGLNDDTQNIQAQGVTNMLFSSKSKKRSRHGSKSRSGSLEVDFIGGIALPESQVTTSPCDTRSAKRRKGPGHARKTHNMADQSKLGLGLRLSTAFTPRENAANDTALGS
ncbi:hypothetical protein F4813DRAFT_377869 [Daldinia decipiens]|uniref:uncharacterized protein n=1 Tax=Daldinia decipiens TaxID=326647 RepID=UPI0020C2225A|nr:uncharacterized protein F4813DRAFT_377869 [Daldinia decipiens]KAI1652449.1 hypothetical protein F4813DRAFT_377869 [Daldinia decipiens]